MARHAGASRVCLSLAVGDGSFEGEIADDGPFSTRYTLKPASARSRLACIPAMPPPTTITAPMVSRLTRAGLIEALAQPYALAARAKGLTEHRVLFRHALRNALLPVVTVLGGRVGFLFAGAVLTESVFAWPGLGRLLFDATLARDYPVLLGMFILISLTVILVNLISDFAYAVLDPRIHYT